MDKRKLFYSLSPEKRMLVRKLYYFPVDLWNSILGNRHKYEPPKGEIYVGSGDFIQQGQDQLKTLQQHIDLQATDAVLDVGCGIGRTAVALTEFLNQEGKYEGFDVVEKGIQWCQSKISKDFPNFHFQYVPLHNDLYNTIKQESVNFNYPYTDNLFNKVFLFSVFTHMQYAETAHYLKEIQRVLKKDGACLATFFIYDEQTETKSRASNSGFSFPVKKEGYYLMSEQVKAANVAFLPKTLEQMAQASGLSIHKIIKGYWRPDVDQHSENSFQDMVVFIKK